MQVRTRWGIPDARVVVAHHGPGQYGGAPAAWTGAANHFLYVGDDEPRKDVDVLVEGYRRYRAEAAGGAAVPLVLAGAVRRSHPGVEAVARPAPDRLRELYAQAAAVVHPARDEGFGLTLLEAMQLGVPVLCAASAAAREVCGPAARYVDPGDVAGLAAELGRLGSDAAQRGELSRAGRERAAAFSWEQSARAHVQAYTLALA